jgi:hypothetical protein
MWIRTSSYIILFSVSNATTAQRVVGVHITLLPAARNLVAEPRCVMTKSLVHRFMVIVNVATNKPTQNTQA